MASGGVDNDTRGWIMCVVSGIACVLGASIIFVDLIVRRFPGKRDFRIQDSSVFLACSLSLSFGVMLFSALYSMLPSSKHYLKSAGYSDQVAGLTLMACFAGGFFGIQTVSRFLHQFMPSHVVDCDHSHKEGPTERPSHSHSRRPSRASRRLLSRRGSMHPSDSTVPTGAENGRVTESTPLLITPEADQNGHSIVPPKISVSDGNESITGATLRPVDGNRPRATPTDSGRRPSILQVQKRVISFVKDTKTNCDEMGPCYGYSDPCGQECFKHISNRVKDNLHRTTALRATTRPFFSTPNTISSRTEEDAESEPGSPRTPRFHTSRVLSWDRAGDGAADSDHHSCGSCDQMEEGDVEAQQHHHHVPANAFLSIGLQTSIAIALHKFPEGFITYATNHVNPTLGFNVFMALFVHNITEGFAMALPLYLALGSRLRAMFWALVLGGLSQPLGAGIAVLWFKLANHTKLSPDAVAYACLFAITAGIMVSVALQLFVESLSLNHNRNLCMFFSFLGMALLGLSSAMVGGN